MENNHVTTIHTDNLPTVHAWKRMKMGAFSTSARIASFLTGISALRVEIVHKPGKGLLVSDYNSRHPNSCSNEKCKICQFAFESENNGNTAIPMVCSVSVTKIENGSLKMPFTQRTAWAKVQAEDKVHKMLFKLIETSSVPEKKKTTGDYTRLKRLHNLYRNGQLKIEKDGLTVILNKDSMGNENRAISVPHNFFPGLVNSLHIKLQHPSKAQMLRLISRYFYCSGQARIVNEVVSNCELCRSLQELPKELFSESTEQTPIFGRNYSADILKKDGQLIFLCREKLTQFTTSKIIPDETADSLRDAIVASTIEFMPETGAIIQVDCAPGLQTLAKESRLDGSVLKRLGILIDTGRTLNVNKNPIAENCIKEFHKERLRLNIPPGKISEISRSLITKNMNSRIRERGFTPKEMALNRDQINNHLKPVNDQELSQDQVKRRVSKHNKSQLQEDVNIEVGDDVYMKNDKSKYRGRERYKVVKIFEKTGEMWAIIQKINDKFMAKEYEVKLAEIFSASQKSQLTNVAYPYNDSAHSINDQMSTPNNLPNLKSKRQAAKRALGKIYETKHISSAPCDKQVNRRTTGTVPTHAWNHDDWIALCETEDNYQEQDRPHTPQSPGINNTVIDSFLLPKTPNLNSILRFNIAQLRDNAHTSSALLQKFPPSDEPEIEWDHSPEYLIYDGHYTWDETNNIDDKVEYAIQPRSLFQVTESLSESVTSSASDDSTFFDDTRLTFHDYTPINRSDTKRKPVRRGNFSRTPILKHACGTDDMIQEEVTPMDRVSVSNLAHLEIQLDDTEPLVFCEEASQVSCGQVHDNKVVASPMIDVDRVCEGRSRRLRKPVDYKQLHTVGRTEGKEREKKEK